MKKTLIRFHTLYCIERIKFRCVRFDFMFQYKVPRRKIVTITLDTISLKQFASYYSQLGFIHAFIIYTFFYFFARENIVLHFCKFASIFAFFREKYRFS